MSKKKEPVKDERLVIERAWETWPGRKKPASTQNMHAFFRENSHLMDHRVEPEDKVWQQVKLWLIAYERSAGRRGQS